jgi:hypothetical protein
MQPLQYNIVTSKSTQQTLFSYDSASSIASVIGKKVALDFEGGNITNDTGWLLLPETESNQYIISVLTLCMIEDVHLLSCTVSMNSIQRLLSGELLLTSVCL